MRHILNSAVLPAGAYGTYTYAPASAADLRAFCAQTPLSPEAALVAHVATGVLPEHRDRPRSSIGYPETAHLIERLTGWRPPLSRDPTVLEPGDVAMVVRLRYRVADPGRKGAPVAARWPDDWEIARLTRGAGREGALP